MTDLAAIITALTGTAVSVGAAVRFVWGKVETRFAQIEAKLDECEKREDTDRERRAVQLTVIELLWREVEMSAPESPVLIRAKRLLDRLKTQQREDGERP